MKNKKLEYAVIGIEGYGLYFGKVKTFDGVSRTATIEECRQICRWYGGSGGISSLAKWGPSGPKKDQSRIAAPNPMSELTRVAAVHYCTNEAVEAFASFMPEKP